MSYNYMLELCSWGIAMTQVRPAAVAGSFYPARARDLDAVVRHELAQAAAHVPSAATEPPKAVIVPHAGYVYSGPIAAAAYRQLAAAADEVRRVVLIGPCHRIPLDGLAVPSVDAFDTPLGRVPIDRAGVEAALAVPGVVVSDLAHAAEHALEVQLPFLQVIFGEFSLVPLVAGLASGDVVADVLDRLWGGPETRIVISSDLTHYLDYATAQRRDAETCQRIEALDDAHIDADGACGRIPIAGLLQVARRRGLRPTTLDLRNSGDTAGDRRRVVGYGAWMFTEAPARADSARPVA